MSGNTLSNEPIIRPAVRADLPDIVRLLADDQLGSERENCSAPLPDSYYTAFQVIHDDINNELVVVELNGKIVGVLQLTFIPYITHQGSWRAMIEGVRVDSSLRSAGIGSRLVSWAIERAAVRGCNLVQLTSNKERSVAIRFYKSLGFFASHEGFKLYLRPSELDR